MSFAIIDTITHPHNVASYVDNIAVFDRLDELSGLKLPAKIDFILSILCEQGSLSIDYDTTSQQLMSREMMVLKPGHVIHRYKASSGFRGHVIVVGTTVLGNTVSSMSKVLPCFLKYKDTPVIRLTSEEMGMQSALRSILRKKTYSRGHAYHDDAIRSILEALFYDTLGLYTNYAPQGDPSVGMRRCDMLLHKFIELVESNFRKERSLGFYADLLCVSPKHLSVAVKEASGRTAGEWIDSYVIIDAKMLLRNSSFTIQEISLALNFKNQSFFGKYFKRLTLQSPREYRTNPCDTITR